MSYRFDSSLIPGAYHLGNRGLGVLGSVVRATTSQGGNGPGYLFNDLTIADDSYEIYGLILTRPASGVLTTYEDGSFSLIGANDGYSYFTYRLFRGGVDQGVATVSILIGNSVVLSTATTLQVNLSSTGAVSVGSPGITLYAVNCTVGNTSTSGIITTPSNIYLTPATSLVSNLSSAVIATVIGNNVAVYLPISASISLSGEIVLF